MAFVVYDADGNVLNRLRGTADESFIGREIGGGIVASVEQTPEPTVDPTWTRRAARSAEFAATLDALNPVWYDSLTDTQKTNLSTWRAAWLNYPETGTEPSRTLVEDIFR